MIRMVNDPLAGGRERKRPHSPHEQFHAEQIFESTDLNALDVRCNSSADLVTLSWSHAWGR
jgi:hypothetical protein